MRQKKSEQKFSVRCQISNLGSFWVKFKKNLNKIFHKVGDLTRGRPKKHAVFLALASEPEKLK